MPFDVTDSNEVLNLRERLAERFLVLLAHDGHHDKDIRRGVLAGFVNVTIEFLNRADDTGKRSDSITLYNFNGKRTVGHAQKEPTVRK